MNQRPPGYEPDELPTALPRDILCALLSVKVLYYINNYIASLFLIEFKIFILIVPFLQILTIVLQSDIMPLVINKII